MLDDVERRTQLDPRGMFGILSSLPEQLEEGLLLCADLRVEPPKEGRIVVIGMGGSAIAGDIGAAVAREGGYEVLVIRNSRLPSYIQADDLLIFISYSGDTWETLSSYQEALKRGIPCLTISSGGELQQISDTRGTPHVALPRGVGPPRGALGYLLAPLIAILALRLPALTKQMGRAIQFLGHRREGWAPAVPTTENEAKAMAWAIRDRTPIIYASPSFAGVAKRWQTQLNENAKVLAWSSVLPEADHNEIVGWMEDSEASRFAPIILVNTEDQALDTQIIEAIALMEEKLTVQVVRPSPTEYLSQVLELILLGDLVSLYLAVVRGVDPFPVEPIVRLKGALSSRRGRPG
ncbi:MAG: bifunctional phosphoglucose/phosphomannose isomerase [Thermoplasmata archaeon]